MIDFYIKEKGEKMKDKFIERLTKLIEEVSKMNEDFSPQAFNYMKKEYGLSDDKVRNELNARQSIDNALKDVDMGDVNKYNITAVIDDYDTVKVFVEYDDGQFRCYSDYFDSYGEWFDNPLEAVKVLEKRMKDSLEKNYVGYLFDDKEKYHHTKLELDYNKRDLENWGKQCQQFE